jgi:hypothetical protein
MMHTKVRDWIVEVLKEHEHLVALAVRQRAKFEGWLKFELAYKVSLAPNVSKVKVELNSDTEAGRKVRADISFYFNNADYSVELKTPNTNWRVDGVENKIRPITKNIASIVSDGEKLMSQPRGGIIAFVLFPVHESKKPWLENLKRISDSLNVPLSESEHTTQISVPLADGKKASLVVCAFTVPHRS